MEPQEQVESKTYPLGTERKSAPLAGRNADSAAQRQQSHTQSGAVCVDVKQRALPLSFSFAKLINQVDTAITFRTALVDSRQVRTRKDTDKHLHGRW